MSLDTLSPRHGGTNNRESKDPLRQLSDPLNHPIDPIGQYRDRLRQNVGQRNARQTIEENRLHKGQKDAREIVYRKEASRATPSSREREPGQPHSPRRELNTYLKNRDDKDKRKEDRANNYNTKGVRRCYSGGFASGGLTGFTPKSHH